jgi:hypothetical protein
MAMRNPAVPRALAVIGSIFLAVACSPSNSSPDAGSSAQDAGHDPKHDSCTQPGDKGNNLHVGEYCTASDGVCEANLNLPGGTMNAFVCTLEDDPTASLAMCTKPCTWNGDCGDNAICEGDPCNPGGPSGCVPSACSPGDPGITSPAGAGDGGADASLPSYCTPVDAGTDAGSGDAGEGDAGSGDGGA